ncbi:MAG: S8 family peptidase [Bdellovibrionales bacterium]
MLNPAISSKSLFFSLISASFLLNDSLYLHTEGFKPGELPDDDDTAMGKNRRGDKRERREALANRERREEIRKAIGGDYALKLTMEELRSEQSMLTKIKEDPDGNLSMRTRTGKIKIAVIDTGVDIEHEILKNNILLNSGEMGEDSFGNPKQSNGIDDDGNGFIDDYAGWDFADQDNTAEDKHGHGTHISGIIVSNDVEILPLKFFKKGMESRQQILNTVNAIDYAIAREVDIINYSAGGGSYSFLEKAAIARAKKAGIIFVAAAGNEATNTDITRYYPASYGLSNIISVGNVDKSGKLLSSSNFGKSTVDVAAVGHEVYSSLPNNRYGKMTGTSQATAVVSRKLATYMRKSLYENKPIVINNFLNLLATETNLSGDFKYAKN